MLEQEAHWLEECCLTICEKGKLFVSSRSAFDFAKYINNCIPASLFKSLFDEKQSCFLMRRVKCLQI